MSFRHAVFAALSAVTLAVAPATAQVVSSGELNAPLTRVSELVSEKPLLQPRTLGPEGVETEEQFPKVSTLEEPVSVTSEVQSSLEVVNKETSKERSQTESESRESTPLVEANQDIPKADQPHALPSPTIELSQIEQLGITEYRFDGHIKLEQFNPVEQKIEQSQPLEPSRVTGYSFGAKTIVPFEKTRTNDKPANNIVRFKAKGRLNQVEPSQPVVETRVTVSSFGAPPARPKPELREGQPSLAPQVTLATRTDEQTVTGLTPTLETSESLSRSFGASYPKVTPKTAFGLDREFSTTPDTGRTQNIITESRNKSVRTISTRASDLGGAVEVQTNFQPVVVETQQEAKPESKPKPKGKVSVGVLEIGGEQPVLETSASIEYNGFSTTLSFNHPLLGTGQDTIGISTTLPLSDRASLTVKADEVNLDPIISATVESKILDRLTGSVSLNSINRPDFNAELAAKYEINQHWSTNASFNVTTRQVNVGGTYTNGRGFDVSLKVDNVAENPQLGVGLGFELSTSTRLELSGSDLTTDPTFGVKATVSF